MKKQNLRLLLVTIALVSFGNSVNATVPNAATKGSALGWLKMGVKAIPFFPIAYALHTLYSQNTSLSEKALILLTNLFDISLATGSLAAFMDLGAKAGKSIDTKINPQRTGEWGSVLGAGIVGGAAIGGSFAFPTIDALVKIGYVTMAFPSWRLTKLWNTLSEKEELPVSATLKNPNKNLSEVESIKKTKIQTKPIAKIIGVNSIKKNINKPIVEVKREGEEARKKGKGSLRDSKLRG